MINPGAIPQIDSDVEALARAATDLGKAGADFASTGADVDSTWQGLAGVYEAPESGLLLSATGPVRTNSAAVDSQVARVATALTTYANEVRTLKAELAGLQSDASAFVSSVSGDDDWNKDGGKVDEHNGLLQGVNAAVARWMEAQRTCANSINAVYGGTQYVPDNGDENHEANEYGFSEEQLDGATASDDGVPWGKPVEQDHPWYRDAWNGAWSFGKGVVVDGLWGAVTGLGGMVGLGGWETFKESWSALGQLGVAIAFTTPGLRELASPLEQAGVIPSADQRLETLKAAGKSLVAWDMWGEDPARAAGATLTNIVTAIVGTKGAGAALKAGTVGRVTAALTGTFPRLAEIAGRISASTAEIRLALRTVDAPDIDVNVRSATPLNDADLAKADPVVGAQVTQIRQDIAPVLQEAADDAWQAAIDRAAREGVDATPQRLGSYAHTELSSWIRQNQADLVDPSSGYLVRSEISFDSTGTEVKTGTAGSVRPDVVIEREVTDPLSGSPAGYEVVHVYDLKTGQAGISTGWANRVTNALDLLDKPEELRPTR